MGFDCWIFETGKVLLGARRDLPQTQKFGRGGKKNRFNEKGLRVKEFVFLLVVGIEGSHLYPWSV